MKIFLLGYMGSGKSTVGRLLAEQLSFEFLDLDQAIELQENIPVSTIFQKKGELYFRKQERKLLEWIIAKDKAVISLGGGTPCYGDNLDLIKDAKDSKTVYLKMSVQQLTDRLEKEKEQRPLISHLDKKEELEEFIRKHLFERGFYYSQSELIINCDNKKPQEIVDEIVAGL
ncbi:shikimate kinase [Christiangramia fulva]|uniref:Shikimate kinase n=1 Tax=Christiangramia fulva TaxID=2126553 RepID=A0A2R3Z0Z7_9FLAO|nr:shikimate kinase [Christiangramia fulva]AVR43924.1 shikimate kinase [Christiangramia fulva]